MKVYRFSLTSLHNEEWFDLHLKYTTTVDAFGAGAIGLDKLMDSYLPVFHKADNLLQVIRKSPITPEMDAADKKRDNVFRGFAAVVKGSLKQPNEEKSKAALRVFDVLNGYRKSILNSTLSEESGALYNLLQDLHGAHAADVTLLGFSDWTAALAQAEQEYLALYNERIDESASKPKEVIRPIRVQLDTIYTAAMNILDAQLLIDGLGGDTILDPEDETPEEGGGGPVEDSQPIAPKTAANVVYNFVVNWNEQLKKYHYTLQRRAGQRAKNKTENNENNEDNASDQPVED
ncbi:MAG: DUF6261 family protein [Tannerellaceae bacterium]|jgi:hypothetical protein|nr:DUF6261 family protein [Tannerellaceae bacterium]